MTHSLARHAALAAGLLLASASVARAQVGRDTYWTPDGTGYYELREGQLVQADARQSDKPRTVLNKQQLTPAGQSEPLRVRYFTFADDGKQVLLTTNTKRVWRYDTRGDYWLYDMRTNQLTQLGKGRAASSLMFAKFAPDGTRVAYVSEHNLFVENLTDHRITQLTQDGTDRLINGTFDWVYEEELDCRDGFRWSPDGKNLAYWQLDARKIPNYLMLNTTEKLYPFTVPVEYPVVGEDPSRCRVGVVPAAGGTTTWLAVPGDQVQHYLPRMEWADAGTLILEQLNRRQNESQLMLATAAAGDTKPFYKTTDAAWVDAKDEPIGWDWLDAAHQRFVWSSEKDGWRHLYAVDRQGKEQLLTPGDYDVVKVLQVSPATRSIYFIASPQNATQRYLYRVPLGGGKAERLSPAAQAGWHDYDLSPNGKLALHTFSNARTAPVRDVVSLPDHKLLSASEAGGPPPGVARKLPNVEFFQVKTVDNVTLDGWMVKPTNFDPAKKYPVVFYVYGEPASQTVIDRVGTGLNRLYQGSMADDGYLYVSLDNRGAPAPRGRAFRKAIYHNIGSLNIRDQAMGAAEVLKNPWADTSRVAVWGWSGGGSSTLNLLMQYPKIYKAGISVAAVDNQLNYDNIYQERYMGLLPEDKHFFVDNSPLAHVAGLRGKLLLIHGTGDDNVHYNNAEQMINELVKFNKVFQLMEYPNRSHGISEGEGTGRHLASTYTEFLRRTCPPGAR